MKTTKFALIALTAILTGCAGEEEAREYAKGLIGVLEVYRAEIQSKIHAEQDAYEALASTYGAAADSDLLRSLRADRFEAGDRLADLAQGGKTPTPTAIKDLLKAYAVRESELTKELMFRESDNYDKHLANLHALTVDGDHIDAARGAVEPLTRKPSLISDLKFLRAYGAAAKNCFDEMVCKDLTASLASAETSLKALPETDLAARASLNARITAIKQRQASAGCDKNPVCPQSQ